MAAKEAKKTVVIKNKLGLHARAAAQFVKTATQFRSRIELKKGNRTVNGKSIMGILTLALTKGSKVIIKARGEDSHQAVETLVKLVNDRFGEEE